ncbi:flagellin N-terminal helical domain-containing protein [Alkaliphilus sp. B6464]|uniref:flagellin N-terminal helical domain-containing protein n=1 Tax=Alkaliphilus sp. B6464 TaxID=2731219 RepID=UPI001BA4827A|nr:flagellin [Alkaliphilus sp. B6464]QUH19020.1 flagellin [Alkaliphilus sp. B6464]
MRINNNMMAMNTHRQLGIANNGGAKSMEKLSSGFRINRAGDDAAGLSISEKMRGQIKGLNMASKNGQDGISLIQTAEGALDESHAILQRMRELAVQSANDTNVDVDRNALQAEVDQLAAELTRIADTTEFNTQKLLDGNFSDRTFHIGANENQNLKLSINGMKSTDLSVGTEFTAVTVTGTNAANTLVSGTGANAVTATFYEKGDVIIAASTGVEEVKATQSGYYTADTTTASLFHASSSALEEDAIFIKGADISSQDKANNSITTINDALETVSAERSKLGALQNRLEHTIKNLDTSAENLQASESRIRDVDMAKEMMEQTKQSILQQASTAMLAQANQAPQNVLQLLR